MERCSDIYLSFSASKYQNTTADNSFDILKTSAGDYGDAERLKDAK